MTDIRKITLSVPTVAAVMLFAAGAISNYYTSRQAVKEEVAALNTKLDIFIEAQRGKDAVTELRVSTLENNTNNLITDVATMRVAVLPDEIKPESKKIR